MSKRKTDNIIKQKQNVYIDNETSMFRNDSMFYRFYNSKAIQFIIRHLFVVLSFLIPFLIMLIVFIKAEMHPAGDKQILVIDFWHQYFPFASELQDKLQNGGSLLYSLRSGWGQNFLGIMSYYTASPLNFLSLLVPEAYLRDFLTLLVCVKIGCAGMFMGMFLKNVFKRNDFSIVLFSIPYALCAYLMGYYWNIIWLDTIALMPLVALGVHYLIKEGKFKLYTISLAVAFISNFYIGFFLCVFVALYFIAEVISSKIGIRTILKRFWQILLFSLIGIALTAILILPAYLALRITYSSGNSTFPTQMNFYNDFKNVLANLLAFQSPTHIEGLPNLYCSLLAVIMIGVHALSKKIAIREKITVFILLTFLIFSCNTNVLDYIWHGFHYTNQIPFRFTFIFAFLLLIVAYRAFTQLENISWIHVAGASAVTAGIITIGKFATNIPDKVIMNNVALALAYLALITVLLIKFKYLNIKTISVFMLIPMAIEMYASASNGVKKVGFSEYNNYYDKNKEVQELLETANPKDDDFYRIEMAKSYTLNDPCLYKYYGVSQFSSMSEVAVSNYMENLGLISQPNGNRYYYGTTSPFTNALLNLKYVISKYGSTPDTYLKEIDSSDDAKLYENTAYLPFGFVADSGIKDFKLSNPNNPFYYLNELYKKITGIDEYLYSYLAITGSDGKNAEVTDVHDSNGEINMTGVYNYIAYNSDDEIALNNSDEEVGGVEANSHYHLTTDELKKFVGLGQDDEITNELDGMKLHIAFKYQNDADIWAEGAEMYFYPPSDPDNMSLANDGEDFIPNEPYEFTVDINDAIKESGLAIEGFGIIITDISLVDKDGNQVGKHHSKTENNSAKSDTDDIYKHKLFFNYTAESDGMVYCFFDSSDFENIDTKIISNDESNTVEEDEFSSYPKTNFYTIENDHEYVFPVGYAKEGDTITITAKRKEEINFGGWLGCYVYQINDDLLQKGLNTLKSNGTYDITEHTDTYFKGEIDATTDGYMYTAIPAEGWTAYVDGKKAETTKLCGAVLGVKLDKGKHTVELKYSPPGFFKGIIISATSLIIFILISILVKTFKPKCFEPSCIYEDERRRKKEQRKDLKAKLKSGEIDPMSPEFENYLDKNE